MEPNFWTKRWQEGEIGFHREEAHHYLTQHWHVLKLEPDSEVLVPLCGKSTDMVWLAERGHRIIGVELSPVAVDAFFLEQKLQPTTRVSGPFMIKEAGPYTIWCGDVFALPPDVTKGIAAVYDRAALVAFPPGMQGRYAAKLAELTPAGVPTMLVGLAYRQGEISGPPFSTPLPQVAMLFGPTHSLAIVESRDGLEQSQNLKERGVSWLEESLYILRRKQS
jgi:thiopurine S-methyltransferase